MGNFIDDLESGKFLLKCILHGLRPSCDKSACLTTNPATTDKCQGH